MNVLVLFFSVALAANFVSSTIDFSTTSDGYLLELIARQVSEIVTNRREARIDDAALQTSEVINFDNKHLDLCGPILCISANLTKGTLTGLSGYKALKLDYNSVGVMVNFDVDVLFPVLQLESEYYEMKGNIMDALPLSGKGKLYFQVTDLRVWTSIVMQVTDHTSIENFSNSGFSIKRIFSRTEFDGNIDGIFNAMVEELLVEHLNRFNKAIAANVGDVLKGVLNAMLGQNSRSYYGSDI